MEQKDYFTIRLLAKDEQSLYAALNPEDAFSESVKGYIRGKAAAADPDQRLKLVVISPAALDRARFRAAVRNWIREEEDLFAQEKKRSNHTLVRMIIIGVLFIGAGMLWNHYISSESMTYRVISTVGSFALGRAVALWVEKLPENKAKRRMISEMAETSLVEFKRADPA